VNEPKASGQDLGIPSWLIPLGAGWVIVLVTFLAYLPALGAGFIFDDGSFLTDNPLVRASDGLYRFWFTTQAPDYFPLTSTLLWIEWRLWGMDPAGYHVVNVLLHALSAVLIWRVLRRLEIPGAWGAALLFAVHPVNAESVAWITQLKNVLSMVFYATAVLLYVRFLHDGRQRSYVLSLGSFVLALLAKTSVTTTPLVLLLCVGWCRGRISRKDVREVFPFLVISGVLAAVTVWFQYHRAIGSEVVRSDGFLSRLAVAGCAVWFYLYKALVPHSLAFVYPRWTIDPGHLVSYVPLAALLGVCTVLWKSRRGWARPFFFALAYYIVMLLPVLGFFNIYFMRYSLVANHWQYFSLPGVVALVAGLAVWASERSPKWPRPLLTAGGGLLVIAFAVMTWRQAGTYQDMETLWPATLAANPDCFLAHLNIGAALEKQGNGAGAMKHYAEALRANPDFAEAHINVGEALAREGKTREAFAHLERAVQLNPNQPRPYKDMARLLATSGDAGARDGHRAVDLAKRACELTRFQNPSFLETLAAAYAEVGRFDEAALAAQKAIDLAARSGNPTLARQVQEHLRLYRAAKPLRQPGP
jgi:protein O-mannosyl-transferase